MSLMHNIRNFAEIQLQGIIPWAKFSFPDETHTDVANVSIEGKAGLYRIVVSSSYAIPPLGKVVFKDHNSGHEIEGENQDGTWHRIAEYLKASESGDACAGMKTYGLQENDPIGSLAGGEDVIMRPKVIPLPANEVPIPPVALVFYIADPGVWYQNGPALVTRIHADGSYNLTIFPDGSEPFYREKVGQRSDKLKNICWVAYPAAATAADATDPLDRDAEVASLRLCVTELQATIAKLKPSAFDHRKSA